MSHPITEHPDDLTIADLFASDRRLAIICNHCGRFRYMRFNRYADTQKVAAIAQTLRCARCGSQDVDTVPVDRNPKNGYWPAERS